MTNKTFEIWIFKVIVSSNNLAALVIIRDKMMPIFSFGGQQKSKVWDLVIVIVGGLLMYGINLDWGHIVLFENNYDVYPYFRGGKTLCGLGENTYFLFISWFNLCSFS